MNHLAKTYFNQIHQALDSLQDTLRKHKQEINEQKAEYERLTREFWASGKEIAVLKEQTKSFAEMKDENDRLREIRTELDDRLRHILSCTKALGDEFRS